MHAHLRRAYEKWLIWERCCVLLVGRRRVELARVFRYLIKIV
jgi:hypothetical protein